MGTSKSSAELSRKLVGFASQLPQTNRQSISDAALTFKDAVLAEGKRDVGGDLRLSRWGKRGLKLGAGFDVRGTTNATALLRARPQGPWKVLEVGTQSAGGYLIGAGRSRSNTAKSRARGYRTGSQKFLKGREYAHPVRGPIVHPGVKPKGTWTRGVLRGQPKAVNIIRGRYVRALGKQFGL
jgi:hypothetical protein